MAAHAENPNKYRNIYLVLLVLLAVSIIGPEFGITWLTLVTAFGIALVKATMVVREFMHLKTERKLIAWMLAGTLLLMLLFYVGIAPDVQNHSGTNWENIGTQQYIQERLEAQAAGGEAEH